jgi:hypothetical protein
VKTSFVGYLPREGCLTLDHTTTFLFPMIVLLSLGGYLANKVLLRVTFFAWSAALGKIFTMDNIKKHIIVVKWCCMCKKIGESMNHLLLHCEIVNAL